MQFYKPHKLTEYLRLFHLYESAFPVAEKKPIAMILRMEKCGASDVWYFEEGGKFLGLAITINSPDIILIDYFAVSINDCFKLILFAYYESFVAEVNFNFVLNFNFFCY